MMTFDSLSEPSFLHPYRDVSIDQFYLRPSLPLSAHSNRFPRSKGFHQLFHDHKAPVQLDRLTYKLRMKSDLHVKTLKDNERQRHYASHGHLFPRKRSASIRQRSAATRTKTVNDQPFNGIEGNAVHVGTLDDLIKQFHRAELHLIHRPIDPYHHDVTPERPMSKPSPQRTVKQAQALTQYQFPLPNPSRHRPLPSLNVRENSHRPSVSSPMIVTTRQSTALTSSEKRHQDKPICVCNKLTIIDPFSSNFEGNELTSPRTQQASTSYIFPPIRSSGYFTKKNNDEPPPPPVPMPKKRRMKNKYQTSNKQSFESLDQISTDDDASQLVTETRKSMVSLATSENDDLQDPPNTMINLLFTPETLIDAHSS